MNTWPCDRHNEFVEESTARHADGVFYEDGAWHAWLNNVLVAVGPDKPIIQAAYVHHASADYYRSSPDES